MPCVYCRDSFKTFYQQLKEQHGDTTEVIMRGGLAQWMFDLHEKVNCKLDTQKMTEVLKEAGIHDAPPEELCRKRQIKFDCLQKRFAVRKVQYSSADVWDFLLIFMLNLDDVNVKQHEKLSAERMTGYATFVRLLPTMLEMSCGARVSPAANHFCRTMNELAATFDAALAAQQRDPSGSVLFKWVLRKRAEYERMEYTSEYEAEMLYRYGLARAGACMHGSCQ